ncbi:MAG: hypothetical protein NTU98_15435 [Bacteroidetes bacterium]|nr:hypothetical protein [Bacteroidota bacterium]
MNSWKFRYMLIVCMVLFSVLRTSAQIAMPDSTCAGTTRHYWVNGDPGSAFTWKVNGTVQPETTFEIFRTWSVTGNYLLEVQEHSASGCDGAVRSGWIVVHPEPAVTYLLCNDPVTTTNAKPFKLKGGEPPGGIYSGAGISAGVFDPLLAGAGNHTVTYSYSNTWGCASSATQVISVTNPVAFTCNNPLTDVRDNKQYPTVQLGTQCWLAANLDYGNYTASTQMQRDNCTIEKYCFQDNPSNCTSFGGLYQWDEMMQYDETAAVQGFCPPGWHVPTETDWNLLFSLYVNNAFAGGALKSSGASGFNAFLSGSWFNDTHWDFSNFAVNFWSSTKHGPDKAWAHGMNSFDPGVSYYPSARNNAFHLRCVKD